MPVPFPHRPAAKYKAITQYSSPSGAGDSLFGVPSVFIDQEKKPKAGWVGEAWYMNVLDQFQRASNSASLSTWTAIIMPYDMPSERTSLLLMSLRYANGPLAFRPTG